MNIIHKIEYSKEDERLEKFMEKITRDCNENNFTLVNIVLYPGNQINNFHHWWIAILQGFELIK